MIARGRRRCRRGRSRWGAGRVKAIAWVEEKILTELIARAREIVRLRVARRLRASERGLGTRRGAGFGDVSGGGGGLGRSSNCLSAERADVSSRCKSDGVRVHDCAELIIASELSWDWIHGDS